MFKEQNTLAVYRKRFEEYANNGGVVNSPDHFYLTTLESLKKGQVLGARGRVSSLEGLFGFVENVAVKQTEVCV